MANRDLRRNIILELKLQVATSKLIRLRNEVQTFLLTFVLPQVSEEDKKAAAERLEEVNNELENSAPNLHS